MPNGIILGGAFPPCGEDRQGACENFLEQECQKCGASRCNDHVARCIECHLMSNFPQMFCFSCAQDHEREKSLKLRGNCVSQYEAEYASLEGADYDGQLMRNPEAIRDRRIEKYKRMGLL